MTDPFATVPLLPSARVHRVFHRIGIVLGGLVLIAAAAFTFAAIWSAVFTSPKHYSRLSQIPSYDLPDIGGDYGSNYRGDLDAVIVVSDGYPRKMTTTSAFIETYNKRQSDSHWYGIWDNLAIAAFLSVAATLLYVVLRSIGWVVAGAFKF